MEQSQPKRDPTTNPPVSGSWVDMGGHLYLVPPLNFKGLREIESDLKKIAELKVGGGGLPSEEQMQSMVKIVHTALRRNYSDLALEAVTELVDMGNLGDLITAVLKASGLRQAPPKEAGPA